MSGFAALLLAATAPAAAPIEVEVDGLRSGQGQVIVTACPREHFLQSCRWHAAVPANAGGVTVTLPAVPPGRYAIQVFHDLNGNGLLDTYWFGLPKEPFGFSNDAMKRIARPSFDRAAIQHGTGAKHVTVKVRTFL